ncbi:hypothetical protein [Pandoraea terrigena]|uniref:Uncharacterized protein n=1 Tax=Pandoraea terrigena TaxID=2508292 RepID=A0A5E4TSH9_9BURK|nr:hypothetical protein [Pandoraea terrigena]VVD88999.1 hypothetical protein PTE31013_01529 [Pandoraea terrigena]
MRIAKLTIRSRLIIGFGMSPALLLTMRIDGDAVASVHNDAANAPRDALLAFARERHTA